MANEWHYSIKGKQVGPVSANDLRKLVADGSLGQNDLIWKEGMAEWRKAGTVNGLFPTASTVVQLQTSGPPPIPVLPPPTVAEQARTGVTTLRESAKLTAQLAAKQAEATKIQQVSLPNAFAKLGWLVYDNSLSTTGEIKYPDAFAKETSAIEQLQTRASEIQAEMADLKRQMSHQGEEMHRLAGSAAKGGYSLLYSTIVVGVSAIFCAPIGLFLIWRHPTWAKAKKIRWAGVSIASFLLLGTLGQMQQTATRESLAKADALWNSGAQADAIDSYRSLIDDLTFLNPGDQSRILRRVIEYDCEQDNPEEARQLIEKARRYGIILTLTNSTAKGMLAEIDAEEKRATEQAASLSESEDAIAQPTSDVAFSESEKLEIDSDQRLRLAHSMGQLDQVELGNYLNFKSSWKRSGSNPWGGTPANMRFLMMIDADKWPTASHRLGLSRDEYRHATNLLLGTQGVSLDKVPARLRELTGESIDDY